jgi:putative radical SAM enzyme (TIGR03279 family)
MPVKITDILGQEGFFRRGDKILSIDGKRIEDQLDLFYILSGRDAALFRIERESGKKIERKIRLSTFEKADPVFEEMRFTGCASRCIFCFVDQMPADMRESLYFKDDDYRLSFLFGNYITLNDIAEDEISRIINYNLSPIYVSVHATDIGIRKKIFGRQMRSNIMETLSKLSDGGVSIHTQVVIVPGVNDGRILRKTIENLFTLYPACRSLALVPVGLTSHRKGLPKIDMVSAALARELIDLAKEMNDIFRAETAGGDFVFASDELYLKAGRILPEAETYGGFEQLSNGVGMSRLFIDGIKTRIESLKRRGVSPKGSMTVVTGRLGKKLLSRYVLPLLSEALPDLTVNLVVVGNTTFGMSVSVSGLLSGADVRASLRRSGGPEGVLVLPPNSVNHEGRMIDDVLPSQLSREFGVEVVVPEENFLENIVLRAIRRSIT